MKKLILMLVMSLFVCNYLMAQASKKPDSEIIREFKDILKSNEFLEFRERAEALKPIKTETLKTHKVYKDLIDMLKNEDANALVRKISLELLLYFRAESHEILGLENDLIGLLQAEATGWYMRKSLITVLPDLINSDDKVNMDKLRAALMLVLGKKEKISEPNSHINELKRTVIGVLEKVGVAYGNVKSVIEPELKDPKSDLKSAIIKYLADYSNSHKDFSENEIKNFCRNAFKANAGEYSLIDLSNAIRLYANLLSNEENFRLQGSDEEIFFNFLKNDNDQIIIAAAKALSKVRSFKGVDKMVERLQEVMTKSEEARNALIDALIYMEANILYAKGEVSSPSQKKAALTLIRDKFAIILAHPSVKGTLQKKLFDAFDLFGIQFNAYEYIDLETLKKLVNILANLTDEDAKKRLGDILSNYTGENYGANAESWSRWVKEEEKSPSRKFK